MAWYPRIAFLTLSSQYAVGIGVVSLVVVLLVPLLLRVVLLELVLLAAVLLVVLLVVPLVVVVVVLGMALALELGALEVVFATVVVVDAVEVVSAADVSWTLTELELNPKVVLVLGISGTKVVTLLVLLVAKVEYPASVELAVPEMRLLISGSTEVLAEFAMVLSRFSEGLSLQTLAKLTGKQIRVYRRGLICAGKLPCDLTYSIALTMRHGTLLGIRHDSCISHACMIGLGYQISALGAPRSAPESPRNAGNSDLSGIC